MAFLVSLTSLGGAATYTSGTRQRERHDRVTGTVFADQAGNIFIEQSFDGTNWDVSTTYAIVASTGKGFSEELVAPYWRLRYVNGATPQTVFRIYATTSAAGDS